MLPDVDAEDRRLAFHQRVVLVGRALDRKFAVLRHEPGPAAAEAPGAGLVHLFLERVEAAERGRDRFGNRTRGGAALARAHDLPEHRVVDVTATVVAHGRADVLGNRREVLDEVLGTLA